MNHPSKWAKFYDERTGTFRYKHKGSGIVCDTLMAIGKKFGKTATGKAKDIAKKAVQVAVAKTGEKFGEKIVSKAVSSDKKAPLKYNFFAGIAQNNN